MKTYEVARDGCKSLVKVGSGGRIRTYDLRVMSPTSCLTAPPRTSNERVSCNSGLFNGYK